MVVELRSPNQYSMEGLYVVNDDFDPNDEDSKPFVRLHVYPQDEIVYGKSPEEREELEQPNGVKRLGVDY